MSNKIMHLAVLVHNEQEVINPEVANVRRVVHTFPFYEMKIQKYFDGKEYPLMLVAIPEEIQNEKTNFIGSGVYHLMQYADGKYTSIYADSYDDVVQIYDPTQLNFRPFATTQDIAFVLRGKNGYKFTSDDVANIQAMMLEFVSTTFDIDIEIGSWKNSIGENNLILAILRNEKAIKLFTFLSEESKKEYYGEAEEFLNRFELHPTPIMAIEQYLTDETYFLTADDIVRKIKIENINYGGEIQLDYILPEILEEYNYVFTPDTYPVVYNWIRQVLMIAAARRAGFDNLYYPNIMALGAAGTGKTFLAEILPKLLESLGLRVAVFNVGSILSIMPNPEDDIFSFMRFDPERGTIIEKTQLARFLEEQEEVDIKFIVLDEVNRVDVVGQNKFFHVMNNPRPDFYSVYGLGEFRITTNTCYFSIGNTGSGNFQVYTIDEAFLRRHETQISFGKQVERTAYQYVYDIVAGKLSNAFSSTLELDKGVLENVFKDNREELISLFIETVQAVSNEKTGNSPIPVGLALFYGTVQTFLVSIINDIIVGVTKPTINQNSFVNSLVHTISNSLGTDISTVKVQYPNLLKVAMR